MQQGGSEAFKDMAIDIIDSHETAASQPVSPELQNRLDGSELQEAAQQEGSALANSATGEASESGPSYGDAYDNIMYGEASKEERKRSKSAKSAEAGGTAGDGGTEGGGGVEGGGGTEGGGVESGNWLVAMAGRLAKVQANFLQSAMDNLAIMETMSQEGLTDTGAEQTQSGVENKSEGQLRVDAANKDEANQDKKEAADAKRNKFLIAQSKYSANMQMFNLMAQATSTSIKTVGEALSAIARKQ